MRKSTFVASLLLAIGYLSATSCFAQTENAALVADAASAAPPAAAAPSPVPSAPAETANAAGENSGLSRFGVGLQLSEVGPGAELAFELTRHINLRGGFNYFQYTTNFISGGVNYGGTLKFESGEAHFDYFLWRSLHVSPGVLFSNGSLLTATMSVPAGQDLTLSGTKYQSNGLGGTGFLNFRKVAPTILFGTGNLVPRGNHRFSMELEIGGAFRGAPSVALNFTGSVCDQNGNFCQNVATNSAFQNSVIAQQNKFNSDISFLKFYPIISAGFGFKL